MAEAFVKMSGANVEAYSAGSRPGGFINERAIVAMKELGYDLQLHSSKSLEEVKKYAPFDVVITMGCGDACHWMPASRFVDWTIPDPKEMEMPEFLRTRDLIHEKVNQLLAEIK